MAAAYDGKVAAVTGGASGIGEALVRALHAGGARVVIFDRDAANGRRVAGDVGSAERPVTFDEVDVTDADALDRRIADVYASLGRLDYLFNNAGVGSVALAHELTLEDWVRVLDVNLMGVVAGVQAAYPRMVAAGTGHIINTASLAGLVPIPGCVSDVAAKSAILGLTQALRLEGAPLGVRVSVVCPAVVPTPIFDHAHRVGLDPRRVAAFMPGGAPVAADVFVAQLLRGVAKNQGVIAPGAARWLWWLHRYLPWLPTSRFTRFYRGLVALRAEQP